MVQVSFVNQILLLINMKITFKKEKSMPTFEEKYAELKKKRDEMEKEFQSLAGELFKEKASGLFEKYPTLKSFGWAQYTPYFNDGDECIFGVNDENIYFEMDGEY